MNAAATSRVDTVEKLAALMQQMFSETREYIDRRFSALELRMDTFEQRMDILEKRMDAMAAEILHLRGDIHWLKQEVVAILITVDELETQGARQAGYSKEIDHVLERILRIEKHIKLA